MWSALSASRLLHLEGRRDVEVILVAPEPFLHVRPRLYEENPPGMKAPIETILKTAGVQYVRGTVEKLHTGQRLVEIVHGLERRLVMSYDRLVLATGSKLFRPQIQGLAAFAMCVARRLFFHASARSGSTSRFQDIR